MDCEKCSSKAIFRNPTLCKDHFINYFEDKVKNTIKEYSLLDKKDKICVAASGGKDSVSLLYILNKLGYDVTALAIDEGITGYRNHTLAFLRNFCDENNIKLVIKSYQKEMGKKLDTVVPKGSPACHICGTFRRHLLNKYTNNFDKIATGHNLDDECQAVIMNIFKAQTKLLFRQGPITSKIEGFTRKVKPLYLLKEKEIMTYSFLKKLNTPFNECPYAKHSFRFKVRDLINNMEYKKPGVKENIVRKYLDLRVVDENISVLNKCTGCGSPCNGNFCKACRLKEIINQ